MPTPQLHVLSEQMITGIIDEAMDVLSRIGFYVENREALTLLADNGITIDSNSNRAFCSQQKLEEVLKHVPQSISLYDREGSNGLQLERDSIIYAPGSAAVYILDHRQKRIRTPVSTDGEKYYRLVQKLDYIKAQSTALIFSDVPKAIADSYRLYLALLHCTKPIVTGTFRKESFEVMKNLLVAVRGSEEALRNKPLAIFDACPSPPLQWSDLTAQSIIDCARMGIPSECVSMPLSGATAPVTLRESLVQHTAENFSGILIAQSTEPGAPFIYGGSPAILDMRHGTTPMGAIETIMIDCAYSAIGKYLNIPVHTYMGLSDAKHTDYQAGFESGIGIILSALSGINMISGAGMLNFENCQSLEKLVLDNEICGMAYRLREGIVQRDSGPIDVLMKELLNSSNILEHTHTHDWFRKEFHFPGITIDRKPLVDSHFDFDNNAIDQAAAYIDDTLKNSEDAISSDLRATLHSVFSDEARKYGMDDREIQ